MESNSKWKNACLPEWLEGFIRLVNKYLANGKISCWHVSKPTDSERILAVELEVYVYVRLRRFTTEPTEPIGQFLFDFSSFPSLHFYRKKNWIFFFLSKRKDKGTWNRSNTENTFQNRAVIQKLVVRAKSMLSSTTSKSLELIRSSSFMNEIYT